MNNLKAVGVSSPDARSKVFSAIHGTAADEVSDDQFAAQVFVSPAGAEDLWDIEFAIVPDGQINVTTASVSSTRTTAIDIMKSELAHNSFLSEATFKIATSGGFLQEYDRNVFLCLPGAIPCAS